MSFGELEPYTYARLNPGRFDDPSGLRSRVCCRKIPWIGLLGFRHCYVESVSGTGQRTSCGLLGGLLSDEPFATGRIHSRHPFNTGGECGEWNESCAADQCVVSAAQSYANPSEYRFARGPNSNTFAGTLARACNLKLPDVAGAAIPGWNDAPAKRKRGRDSEPVLCQLP
jgi:hypothetical protein